MGNKNPKQYDELCENKRLPLPIRAQYKVLLVGSSGTGKTALCYGSIANITNPATTHILLRPHLDVIVYDIPARHLFPGKRKESKEQKLPETVDCVVLVFNRAMQHTLEDIKTRWMPWLNRKFDCSNTRFLLIGTRSDLFISIRPLRPYPATEDDARRMAQKLQTDYIQAAANLTSIEQILNQTVFKNQSPRSDSSTVTS